MKPTRREFFGALAALPAAAVAEPASGSAVHQVIGPAGVPVVCNCNIYLTLSDGTVMSFHEYCAAPMKPQADA